MKHNKKHVSVIKTYRKDFKLNILGLWKFQYQVQGENEDSHWSVIKILSLRG